MNAETNKSLESLAQQFAIEGKVKEVKPLGDGLINDTYLVAADGGERYVLQRINRAVFPDIDALQTNLVKITSHIRKCLEDKGVENIDKKVLTPVKVSDGCLWIENDGEAWRMTRYIADSVTRTNLTDEMAEDVYKRQVLRHCSRQSVLSPSLQPAFGAVHDLFLPDAPL